ncbi:MAG: class I SAM-dependent RNA methyltransferase [Propionibacteriaceae bacterium]|jgi:tRNA/tmRNA/rRNA uracil-C5-methylase (TrmA/RlmC/RlmD family)|nr:class I SAM-dependent RNA methyltransferase [Propionibacteriaceae bacterium]
MVLELSPTDVAHGGYAVARHDGMVIFVSGAIPGERVLAEITGKRSKLWFARTVEVVDPSPDRVPHVWSLAERTGIGGVDLGHVSLGASRRWKARVVEGQLARIGHVDVPEGFAVESVGDDETRDGLAWRTRITLVTDEAGRLGMHPPKSHDVVPVTDMPIAHEDIQDVLARDLGGGSTRNRSIPFLADQRVSYVRPSVTTPGGESRVVTVVESRGRKGAEPVHEQVTTTHGTWEYFVSATGFWQVHRDAPSTLVQAVLDGAGEVAGPTYDLYCGAGLFAVPLSERGRVVAIEGSEQGVADLKRNTRGLDVEAYRGDVASVLSRISDTEGGLWVLDPPRAGAGRETIEWMVRMSPDKVIYVACDPASLARDVALLGNHGYELANLRAFDLFPRTHHVECVAVLARP